MSFASKEDLLNGARKIGNIKFNFDCSDILKRSKIMNDVLAQMKISRWF